MGCSTLVASVPPPHAEEYIQGIDHDTFSDAVHDLLAASRQVKARFAEAHQQPVGQVSVDYWVTQPRASR